MNFNNTHAPSNVDDDYDASTKTSVKKKSRSSKSTSSTKSTKKKNGKYGCI